MSAPSGPPWSDPARARPPARVLTCGDAATQRWSAVLADVLPGADVLAVASRPGRAEVDPLLDGPLLGDPLLGDTGLLVVAGDDADLAAVLVRLLRRERLDVPVAFLPGPGSLAAPAWGVPTEPGAVAALLRSGVPRERALIRDDRGGVVAGRHDVGAFHGAVYCDEHLVSTGAAAGLTVRPSDGGVAATVTGPSRWGGLRAGRVSTARGRAVQIGCRPATLHRDGVADERALERRSWYRHVEDWRLLVPA